MDNSQNVVVFIAWYLFLSAVFILAESAGLFSGYATTNSTMTGYLSESHQSENFIQFMTHFAGFVSLGLTLPAGTPLVFQIIFSAICTGMTAWAVFTFVGMLADLIPAILSFFAGGL